MVRHPGETENYLDD